MRIDGTAQLLVDIAEDLERDEKRRLSSFKRFGDSMRFVVNQSSRIRALATVTQRVRTMDSKIDVVAPNATDRVGHITIQTTVELCRRNVS